MLRASLLLTVAGLLSACGHERPSGAGEYRWAFAQNLDGSFHPNEFCRESLAQSLDTPDNKARTVREGASNVFLFTGVTESYRIYAFATQAECETALTHMVQRAQGREP